MSNCSSCSGKTQSSTPSAPSNPARANTSFVVHNQGKGNTYTPVSQNANQKPKSSNSSFVDFAKNYGK